MDYNVKFREKLKNYVFIELKTEFLTKNISSLYNEKELGDAVSIPINTKYIVEDKNISEYIKTQYIVQGMYYVLGADANFKYNSIYLAILGYLKDSINYIKSVISKEYQKGNYEDAFIYLRGLLKVTKEKDIFHNALAVGEILREQNADFNDVQLELLNEYKEFYQDAYPYLIEALIDFSKGSFDNANVKIHNYLAKGGESTEEIQNFIKELEDRLDYSKVTNNLEDKPEEAIKILLQKLDEGENNPSILYYLAIAYRNIELYEKAIYYLYEALDMDNSYIDVINELGINYAALGDYHNSIKYFRAAFDATKSIDICTNLILSYYYNNEIENAKKHIKIAEAINKDDEILKQIKDEMLKEDN